MESESIDARSSVRQSIEVNSTLSIPYIVMNSLATIVACYGLIADSTAVVIGAMIIAMLLGPIIGVALGLVEGDNQILGKALLAEIVGVLIVLIIAAIVGKIHEDVPLGKEIFSRTAPNILDLVIALAGGAAGAYATVSPRLSVGLVGVAISTALVPPLSTCSILLVRGEFQLATGSFLLFFANLVSIQVASAIVLWLHKYDKITNSNQGLKKILLRNAVSFVILFSLIISLGFNFQSSLAKQKFEIEFRSRLIQGLSNIPSTYLSELRFEPNGNNLIITAVVRTPRLITPNDVANLESKLPQLANKSVELRVRSISVRVINKKGYIDEEQKNIDEAKIGQ